MANAYNGLVPALLIIFCTVLIGTVSVVFLSLVIEIKREIKREKEGEKFDKEEITKELKAGAIVILAIIGILGILVVVFNNTSGITNERIENKLKIDFPEIRNGNYDDKFLYLNIDALDYKILKIDEDYALKFGNTDELYSDMSRIVSEKIEEKREEKREEREKEERELKKERKLIELAK